MRFFCALVAWVGYNGGIIESVDMGKIKSVFVCNSCGGQTSKMMGRCPACNAWNTIEEEVQQDVKSLGNNRYQSFSSLSSKVECLADVKGVDYARVTTGLSEFDRVLSGGLVLGGVTLLGGDPGIGKSTLLLQTITNYSKRAKVLYVSGEESSSQIKMRADRLNLDVSKILIYGEIELEKIVSVILREKPEFVVIDSIQTLFSSQLTSAPGSVSQVKECASHLNRLGKENNITFVIICHVTKDGELAGPRALEHIVDTVLFFEGDKNSQYRMIRAQKNRFGSIGEVGIFSMGALGLECVEDPTGVFASGSSKSPGASIFVSQEGNRSVLVEIQALLDKTPMPNPIRRSIGLDVNRLQMLCAVISKYTDVPIYTHNVFVSLLGGVKFSDTGIDLPAFLAMISSFNGKALRDKTVSFGEIGLTGELRQVQNTEDRLREALRMGLKVAIIPKMSARQSSSIKKDGALDGLKIIECQTLNDAIYAAFSKS